MNTLSRRLALTSAVGFSGLAVLSACGQDDRPAEQTTQQQTSEAPPTTQESSEQQPSSEQQTSESPSASEDDDNGGESAQREVKIGKVFNDKAVGDRIEIISAIRHFPADSVKQYTKDGGEVVLLQVKVTPSGQYGGVVSTTNFALKGGDSRPVKARSSLDKDITAGGKKPLGMASRRKGAAEGWVGFLMREDDAAKHYEAAYLRAAAKVIGKDKTLPEFVQTFTID